MSGSHVALGHMGPCAAKVDRARPKKSTFKPVGVFRSATTMTVLAASVCTHGGKVLLSRQFRDLSKDRVTALFANFPSLLASSGSQNTTVEDEAVRYVYQPLDEYYVVLLTNKQSNILQDIDTLHLFVSVVSNMLRTVDEKEIFNNAFELLSAFDEIVNLGYREKLTMLQVQSFLEMDSHEEKIQEIIERNKEMEATEERRRRAKEIQRKELARKNMEQQQAAMFSAPPITQQDAFAYNSAPSPNYGNRAEPEPFKEQLAPRASGKGLQLGKKPAKTLQGEQNQPLLTTKVDAFSQTRAAHPVSVAPSALASPAPVQESKSTHLGILITINEKISAELSREGSVLSSEVKGDLQLRINNSELGRAKILLDVGNKPGIQYKTHPNVDRGLFSSAGSIGLKDKTRSFPCNDQSLGVLRWRATAKDGDSSLLPILITAWVSLDDGEANVTLEYELTPEFIDAHPNQASLDNVQLLVPIASEHVVLKEDSTGLVLYELTENGVVFTIAAIDLQLAQGSFEFSIPADSEDSLFPMQVAFDHLRTENVTEEDGSFGHVRVVDVVANTDDEESLPFEMHLRVASEAYTVN